MRRSAWRTAFLAASVALLGAVGALGIGTLQAQETGVSFANESSKPVQVVTKFGADVPCAERPHSFEFTLLPGESQDVDSGAGSVCYCDRGIANSAASCAAGWKETKPGSRLSLRLGAPLGGAAPAPGACSSGWCDTPRHIQ